MRRTRKPKKLMSKGASIALMLVCTALIIGAVALLIHLGGNMDI